MLVDIIFIFILYPPGARGQMYKMYEMYNNVQQCTTIYTKYTILWSSNLYKIYKTCGAAALLPFHIVHQFLLHNYRLLLRIIRTIRTIHAIRTYVYYTYPSRTCIYYTSLHVSITVPQYHKQKKSSGNLPLLIKQTVLYTINSVILTTAMFKLLDSVPMPVKHFFLFICKLIIHCIIQ